MCLIPRTSPAQRDCFAGGKEGIMGEELVEMLCKKITPGEEVVLARGKWQGFKYIHETEPVFILRAAQAGFSEPGPYGLFRYLREFDLTAGATPL